MKKSIVLIISTASMLFPLSASAAKKPQGFSMEGCLQNVQSRGVTPWKAARICQRNCAGEMYQQRK